MSGQPILRNSTVTTFPPQADVYALAEPVDLESIDDPDRQVATIQSFPLTVGAGI